MAESYREIIDNETNDYSMSKFLNQTIPKHTRVDVATGFFNIGGYGSVQNVLEELVANPDGRFRLLFGRESISDMDAGRDDRQHTLHADLESSVDEERKDRADALIRFLEKSNVYARKSKERFSHAKCYVFDEKKAIVGSSNFTRMGLDGNIELNAVLYQPAVATLVSDWFERRWDKADDAKKDLIHMIEESKFGLPLDPYTMYMKMLYEYYRQRIEDMEAMKGKHVELTEFQQDAVTEAKRILRKYGGVIISDSTGLGKTHIGVELLRFLLMEERRKVLLIAPAQVKNTVWKPRLLEDSVKTMNLSMESVGRSDFEPSKYLNFDIVLIDESHNLRSHAAQRRINIMKILAGGKRKKVILMSATPINNSLMDLYYQLSLITAGDDLYFTNLDIPDLRNHFVQAAKKRGMQEGIDTIVRILDEVMIKRTRTHIKENYPDATLGGKPVRFPKRNLHKIEYSLTNLYGANVYSNVIDTIDRMHLVPYRLVMYDKKAHDDEKRRAGQIAILQKIILTKRFESSVEAIRSSVGRLEKFYDMFERAIDEGKILNSRDLGKILEEIRHDDENDDEKIIDVLKSGKLNLDPLGSNYDKKTIKTELAADRKMISELLKDLEKIKPYGDTKLQKLNEDIIKYEVLEKESKKIVIFTSYVDTARYVHKHLETVLDDKKVVLLTGSVSTKKRQEILEQFAPKSNYTNGDIPLDWKEADVLVTTEVLSEGQNLQDCNYVVNYDLPWNPMRIVQRVGRVDRLTSKFKSITSAVFVPEKELNDLLRIMEKLESKIQTIADVVGAEGSILGEKENPKEFNAVDRIRREDAALIDDIERSAELLTMTTPYQEILKYIKGIGRERLHNIKMGKRSGLRSQHSGVVIMYRESQDIHIVLYDHKESHIVSVNDVTGSFARIKCKENEEISIPFPGNKSFEYIKDVDRHARREILQKVNSGIVKKAGRNVGGKYQIAVREKIRAGFVEERILTHEDVGDTYDILNSMNLAAWEFDLRDIVDRHNIGHDTKQLLRDVQTLFGKYQITKKPRDSLRRINEDDLYLVGCMFLDGPDMKDMKLTA